LAGGVKPHAKCQNWKAINSLQINKLVSFYHPYQCLKAQSNAYFETLYDPDGKVATKAAVAGKKQHDQARTKRIDLTPTGLLMEGHYTVPHSRPDDAQA
jgi:hypothetical protein